MHNTINISNIQKLAKGAAFLGSGGGGDPEELLPLVLDQLQMHRSIPLVSIEHLQEDDLVVAIELIGAPIPKNDRNFPANPLIKSVLDFAQQDLQSPIAAIMAVEIGGSNALTPLCIAGDSKLPLLDADLLGRALPKIPMISTNVHGIMPSRAYICDPETGKTSIIDASSYEELENKARVIATAHKSTAGVLIPIILTGREAKQAAIPNTVSLACSIGGASTLKELLEITAGHLEFRGIVSKWEYESRNGFLFGTLYCTSDEGVKFEFHVQNEYLKLTSNQKIISEVPNIISLIDVHTLDPLLSDQIKIGQSVFCVTCPGPKIWHSGRGLSIIKSANII